MDSRMKKALAAGALAAGTAVAVAALKRTDPHLVRCQDGWVLVSTHRIEGTPVRVMRQGGVWQSAT